MLPDRRIMAKAATRVRASVFIRSISVIRLASIVNRCNISFHSHLLATSMAGQSFGCGCRRRKSRYRMALSKPTNSLHSIGLLDFQSKICIGRIPGKEEDRFTLQLAYFAIKIDIRGKLPSFCIVQITLNGLSVVPGNAVPCSEGQTFARPEFDVGTEAGASSTSAGTGNNSSSNHTSTCSMYWVGRCTRR